MLFSDYLAIDSPHSTANRQDPSYPEKEPNFKLIAKLKEYKANGFAIVLLTARRMKTCSNDEAGVLANVGKTTLDWLKKYDVPFDGIKFGKPFAENGFYIDDKSIRPDEFIEKDYSELIRITKNSVK